MINGHPYAFVLLGLSQVRDDQEMIEALTIEDDDASNMLDRMIDAFERVCDVQYR